MSDGGAYTQPLLPTTMPRKPWTCLAMDFYGPLPNNNELLVVVDEFSRFSVVEEVKSTGAEHVLPQLDKIFSMLGIPTELKSDNGPPANGFRFKEFCDYFGIKHRKITPYYPQANGQVENFMKNINKVIRNAKVENKDWRQQLNQFLRNYRSTPHSTTGKAPTVLLFGDDRTNRLPSFIEEEKTDSNTVKEAKLRDLKSKGKSKTYMDTKRQAKQQDLQVGDEVYMKQNRTNKWMTRFDSSKLTVTAVNGSMITAADEFNKSTTRNASFFKKTIGSSNCGDEPKFSQWSDEEHGE